MTWKKGLIIGAKVLVAVGAAIGIFVGLNGFNSEDSEDILDDLDDNFDDNSKNPLDGSDIKKKAVRKSKAVRLSEKMDNVQDISKKSYAVIKTVTDAVKCVSSLFMDNNQQENLGNYNYNYNNPWGYRQPINMSGEVWNRTSPFTVEVPPTYDNGGYYRSNFRGI